MLQSLVRRLRKIGSAGTPAGWVAVEIDGQGLRAVAVRLPRGEGERPVVLKTAFIEDAEATALSIARLAAQLDERDLPWTLLSERQAYRLMVLDEPVAKAEEMTQTVRWLAGGMLDYPPDEATIDHMQIPTKAHLPDAAQQLYVVAARREHIEDRAQRFRDAGVPLSCVEIRETAQRNVAALLESPDEGLALVAAAEAGVQMTFTFRGELYLDRFLGEPLSALTEADDWTRADALERIAVQVQRSLESVGTNFPFMPIRRVVVAPGPQVLLEALQRSVSVAVEPLDLADIFDLSRVPALADAQEQARFFPLLGAALRGVEVAS